MSHNTSNSVAAQCRDMGLQVGDTIEGTESHGDWWNTTRLTLLYLGATEAVWLAVEKTSERPEWSKPRESANWILRCRDWKKVDHC